MNYLILFLVSFLLSTFLVGAVRKLCFSHGLVSQPRARDVHKKPIPRLGGIAIFLSFFIVSLATLLSGADKHIVAIWLGGGVISLSMLLDDIYGLRAWQKLLFQFISVLVLISAGIGLDTLQSPFGGVINLNSVYIPILKVGGITYHFSLWSDLITLIWIVGMMNIINFIDGVDGLAAGNSLIATMTIFLLALMIGAGQGQVATLAIILFGSVLGFLIWNFPPAKIFMGDSGSMFLGYMLGVLTLFSGGKLATVFLVLGFPIIDGLLVVGGRIRRRQNPFTTPDKTHLHHRFLKAGFSPRQAVLSMYAISIAFAWVALRSTGENKLIAAIILVLAVFALTRILNARIKKLT